MALLAAMWSLPQPERPRGAQLHVRDLHTVVDAAHHQPLFAPVELVCLAQLERQRYEGIGGRPLAFALSPRTDEVRHARVAALVARRLDLGVQRLGRAPLVLGAPGVRLQGLL